MCTVYILKHYHFYVLNNFRATQIIVLLSTTVWHNIILMLCTLILNEVCSYGYNTISINTSMYNLRVCASVRARLLHMRMSFCRLKCCFATDSIDAIAARKTRAWPNQFLVVSIEYLTTNRNTVRFLKFRKSLEYFECIKLHGWWSELKTKSIHIPAYSRLTFKRSLLLVIANTKDTRSECPSAVLLILLYDVRMYDYMRSFLYRWCSLLNNNRQICCWIQTNCTIAAMRFP